MRNGNLGLAVVALLTAILTAISFTFVKTFWAETPVTPLRMEIVNSPLSPSDLLQVRFVTERRQLCKTDADFYIINQVGPTVVWRERIPGISIPIGGGSSIVTVKHPPLAPGNYIFREFLYSECGPADWFGIQAPDARFEVIP